MGVIFWRLRQPSGKIPELEIAFILVFLVHTALIEYTFCAFPGSCQFPIYLQRRRAPEGLHRATHGSSDRELHGSVRAQNTESGTKMAVDGNKITFTTTSARGAAILETMQRRGNQTSGTATCLEKTGTNRYLVLYQATGNGDRYFCLEFLLRSPDVVQVKSSASGNQSSPELCLDKEMRLNPWIFINVWSVGQTGSRLCAMRGGFSMRIFDPLTRQRVCDSFRGETRLESDCVRGDNMHFYFRHEKCLPEGLYMYNKEQRALCASNWIDGPYTFTLLRHDKHRYMWLLRWPTLAENGFTAYLLKDLVADTAEQITETANYFRLDIVRDVPRPVTSLCVDDHDACAIWEDPCKSNSQMALLCPRTCNICNASYPTVTSFPVEVNGYWYDGSDGFRHVFRRHQKRHAHRHIPATASSYIIPSDGIPLPLPGAVYNRHVADNFLVSGYSNGCRPRYVCARTLKRSSVMYLKLSQTLTWPVTSSPTDPVDCSAFNYEYTDADVEVGGLRTRHFRLMFSKDKHDPVECHMPKNFSNVGVSYSPTDRNVGRRSNRRNREPDSVCR